MAHLSQYGLGAPRLRLVHMANDFVRSLGSPDYNPMFEVTTDSDEQMYLTQDGSLFRRDNDGVHFGVRGGRKEHFAKVR